MLAAIACMAANGVIGKNGKLPWECADDMAHFKRLTAGDNVVMGHKTCRSLKGPLPGRCNYVATNWPLPDGFMPLHQKALAYRIHAFQESSQVSWVIGGGQLYITLLPCCSILHLTILHEDYEGDTHFPVALRDELFIEKERHAFADGWFTTWYRKP